MKYYCKLCDKQLKTYNTFWNHNKIYHDGVEQIKVYICNICDERFDDRKKKYYHQKKCTDEKKDNNGPTIIGDNNNMNNMNNVNINGNIIINNYGNDNLEYISEEFKDMLFKKLLKDYKFPLPKLIENIKFNPNHKENNNVKIKSDRSKVGLYYDNDKWISINKDDLLNDLCKYSMEIFTKYFKEKKDDLCEDTVDQYNHLMHFVKKVESELKTEIKKKIENIAYVFTLNNDEKLDV
jgi:hypothetical protein